jgi:hypothetical protein
MVKLACVQYPLGEGKSTQSTFNLGDILVFHNRAAKAKVLSGAAAWIALNILKSDIAGLIDQNCIHELPTHNQITDLMYLIGLRISTGLGAYAGAFVMLASSSLSAVG